MGSQFFHNITHPWMSPGGGGEALTFRNAVLGPLGGTSQAVQPQYSQGPYTGVAPTLAGANAGYRAGGPGAMIGVPNAPNAPSMNPYAAAARSATGTTNG
jgi:hypothetical protein